VTAEIGGKRVSFAGSYGATARDFRAARDLVASEHESLGLNRLITRRYSLPELPDALQRLVERGMIGKSVVVV
jgi:threonine dehydrogenase-like Zn-dependent dehydrogenase